jgi:hypothetical protein
MTNRDHASYMYLYTNIILTTILFKALRLASSFMHFMRTKCKMFRNGYGNVQIQNNAHIFTANDLQTSHLLYIIFTQIKGTKSLIIEFYFSSFPLLIYLFFLDS